MPLSILIEKYFLSVFLLEQNEHFMNFGERMDMFHI